MESSRFETTRLLGNLLRGDRQAADEVMPLIYAELRALAGRIASDGRPGLLPTELIHEAYLRLVDVDAGSPRQIESRLHFKRLAARAMRGVMVDQARAGLAHKRGGAHRAVTLNEDLAGLARDGHAVLDVHQGLDALRAIDEQLADIIELRFFGGMTVGEAADTLGVSESTIHRGWRLARAWWMEEYGA